MSAMRTAQQPQPKSSGPNTRALKNKNLRLYFAGQIISMVGTWMQQMALSWLIYRMTNSAVMLGVIAFATQAPSFLLTPIAGLVADRTNRHRLLTIMQVLAMIESGILATLVLTGKIEIWSLIALGLFSGVITAFDLPTRQTFLVDMLESRAELPNAISVNASIMTITRLLGPALAGAFIAQIGEGLCFLINSLSYIPVIAALMFVKSNQGAITPRDKSPLAELKEGFAYAFGFRPIRALILVLAMISLAGMPYAVLMPAFAKDVFHGNATTLGILSAAAGVGSVAATIYLATRKGVLGLGKWIFGCCILFALGLIAFGFTHSFWVALPILAIVGFGGMVLMAASNTLLQTIVDEDKRGRVMSIFTMSFLGLAPFGSMAAGALAAHIGVGYTVAIGGVFCLLVGILFGRKMAALRDEVRPIYIERGIIDAESEMKVMNS